LRRERATWQQLFGRERRVFTEVHNGQKAEVIKKRKRRARGTCVVQQNDLNIGGFHSNVGNVGIGVPGVGLNAGLPIAFDPNTGLPIAIDLNAGMPMAVDPTPAADNGGGLDVDALSASLV
jgi:hypothetical protein